MGMHPGQLRQLISHVLLDAGLFSEDAVELLMFTAAAESGLGHYLKQISGPARGIFQMEPATEKDIWANYLASRERRAEVVMRYDTADENDLWWNLGYQILLCRLHYLRVPEKLPVRNYPIMIARYWKKYYNTYKGKGDVDAAVKKYFKYVLETSHGSTI